ncbi:MAG: hypothetical protein ACREEL_11630 [Stellaceae bacterium]
MSYMALMFDEARVTRGVRPLNCDNDLSAIDAAKRLLERSITGQSVEVWEGQRRIGRLYRPTPAAAMQMRDSGAA